MTRRGVVAEKIFSDFISLLSNRSTAYMYPTPPAKPTAKGNSRPASIAELRALVGQTKEELEKSLLARHETIAACSVQTANNHTPTMSCPHPQPSIWHQTSQACSHCTPTYPSLQSTVGYHSTVAAFANQPASTPGQHGVPFSGKAHQLTSPSVNAYSGGTPAIATRAQTGTTTIESPPPPEAPRTEILDFLRSSRICFRHAFGIECKRPGCPYFHDVNILPRGFYAKSSSNQPGGTKRPLTGNDTTPLKKNSPHHCNTGAVRNDLCSDRPRFRERPRQ